MNPFLDTPAQKPGAWITVERDAILADQFPRGVQWGEIMAALLQTEGPPLPTDNAIHARLCVLKVKRPPGFRALASLANLRPGWKQQPPTKTITPEPQPVVVKRETKKYPAGKFSMLGGKIR